MDFPHGWPAFLPSAGKKGFHPYQMSSCVRQFEAPITLLQQKPVLTQFHVWEEECWAVYHDKVCIIMVPTFCHSLITFKTLNYLFFSFPSSLFFWAFWTQGKMNSRTFQIPWTSIYTTLFTSFHHNDKELCICIYQLIVNLVGTRIFSHVSCSYSWWKEVFHNKQP